ncbi:hypothetical protein B9T25_04545 [Acinetobacter sp. ANC 4470]|uniref:YdcH family protein n=1 Tax=Acinetobacter sp. ANC 4470 TaxID=1977881 RepID=UPI000A34AF06|nr:YdcH family protein [Acinetobacter sp. ANC 4470]OTG68760.1 hypothetical protein B9T25_04545 [Acinetobacter sp. ANC 4470]
MKTKEFNKKIKRMFPEHQDLIHKLRHDDPHFAKIFESHQELDKEIIQLELNPVNLINDDIESMKRKKLKMKDEIYKMLTKNAQADDLA